MVNRKYTSAKGTGRGQQKSAGSLGSAEIAAPTRRQRTDAEATAMKSESDRNVRDPFPDLLPNADTERIWEDGDNVRDKLQMEIELKEGTKKRPCTNTVVASLRMTMAF